MTLLEYRRRIENVRTLATRTESLSGVLQAGLIPVSVRMLRIAASELQAADCPEQEPMDAQLKVVILEHARAVLLRHDVADPVSTGE